MRLAIVRVSQLPLGRRALRYGDQGNDVKGLQSALQEAGFYFGVPDGVFGTLTAEAVLMLQKAYGLKPDGVAGPAMLGKLANNRGRSGRIVYAVKKQESLTALSQRFGVREAAWESLSGQGNPQKRIYPGMKLYLPEKLLLVWEKQDPGGHSSGRGTTSLHDHSVVVSGMINPFGRFLTGGGLEIIQMAAETGATEAIRLRTIEATGPVWEELFSSRRHWKELAVKIQACQNGHRNREIVFDLRNAPWQTMRQWPTFFKSCAGKNGFDRRRALVLIPLPPRDNPALVRSFWANLNLCAPFFRYVIFGTTTEWESREICIRAYHDLPQFFRKLSQTGLAAHSLWIEPVAGWVWGEKTEDGEAAQARETITFREAQRIRAMFPKGARVSGEAKLMTVEFMRRGTTHSLIYRDETGWFDFAKQIARSQLAGLVIRGFEDLKEAGPAVIQSAFAVTPWKEEINERKPS